MSDGAGVIVKVTIKKEFRDLFLQLDKTRYDYNNNKELCIKLIGSLNDKVCRGETTGGWDGFIDPRCTNGWVEEIKNDCVNVYDDISGIFQFEAGVSSRTVQKGLGRFVKHFLGPIVDWKESYFIGTISEFWYNNIRDGDYTAASFGFGGTSGRDIEQSDYTEWTFDPKTGIIMALHNKDNPNTRNEQVLVHYPNEPINPVTLDDIDRTIEVTEDGGKSDSYPKTTIVIDSIPNND